MYKFTVYSLSFFTKIIREMNRLTETDTEVKFNQNLEIYSKKILQMKPVKREGNDVQELRKKVAAAEDAEKICKYIPYTQPINAFVCIHSNKSWTKFWAVTINVPGDPKKCYL